VRGNGAKAVGVLKRHKSFITSAAEGVMQVSCPAPDLTSMIYLEYGKLLNDPQYQSKLQSELA
jgi:hypothetical protein